MNLISCYKCGCVCDVDMLEEIEDEEGRGTEEEKEFKKYMVSDEYGWFSCPVCKETCYNCNQIN